MSQQKINKLSSAFTLIELIVVITILAILGTISFVSFNDYTKSARDSARVSDLTNISKGLAVYSTTNGTLPLPDKYTEVKDSSGTTISYQGYAGSTVLSLLNISGKVQDNLDKDYYYYTVNSNKSVFQLLGYSENINTTFNIKNIISNTYAINYSKRYIVTRGNEIGFLTSTTDNNPIYNGYNNNTHTGVTTLTTGISTLKLLVNSTTTTTGNGVQLTQKIKENIGDRYPGCDTDNIKIGNQVWSACNVGAITTVGWDRTDFSVNSFSGVDKNILGGLFQWGRNDDISLGTVVNYIYSGSFNGGFLKNSNFYISPGVVNGYQWINGDISNFWGGKNTSEFTGRYSDISLDDKNLMRGPCEQGYHIPTTFEWKTLYNNSVQILGACNTGDEYYKIRCYVKLPLGGRRGRSLGDYSMQNVLGDYWSSTPTNNTMRFYTTSNYKHWSGPAFGQLIRCIKN